MCHHSKHSEKFGKVIKVIKKHTESYTSYYKDILK